MKYRVIAYVSDNKFIQWLCLRNSLDKEELTQIYKTREINREAREKEIAKQFPYQPIQQSRISLFHFTTIK